MVNILIGMGAGIFLGIPIGLLLGRVDKFIDSASVGLGIGLAFVLVGTVGSEFIRRLDQRAQKMKGGAGE